MRLKNLAVVVFVSVGSSAWAQASLPAADWSAFSALLGEWVADKAAPDDPSGRFTLAPDLQGRVLVRRNVAEYPKTKERPAFKHDDLMVISAEDSALRALYWDNEGHFIHYDVAISDNGTKFVFQSQAQAGKPLFRLTYVLVDKSKLAIDFEMASGASKGEFKSYIKATAHKK